MTSTAAPEPARGITARVFEVALFSILPGVEYA
jgi:hypothetical protein